MIERRAIGDRATWLEWRSEDMTASVGACLFGDDIHPYTSAYQQWAFHSGLWKPPPIDRKLIRRGEAIEKIAPDLIRQERPDWNFVEPNRFYYRDPEARTGATPDLVAQSDRGKGNAQVKSVGPQAFRRWKDRDTGETALPVWIAIQANIEAAFMEADWAAVVPITIGDSGLDIEIIDVPLKPALMDKFRLLAADFWRRVREKEPYDVDWGKDAATILGMFADDDGSVVDLTGDERMQVILEQREQCKQIEADGRSAEEHRRKLDAEIILKLGNARAARLDNGLIKAPTVKVKEAVRKAYSYRRISVTQYETSSDDRSSESESLA